MSIPLEPGRVKTPWRLERLPSSNYLKLIAAILGLAFFLEAIDAGTISYFLPVFSKEFHLIGKDLGWLGTVSNVGVAIGTLTCGLFSDMFGRKKTIIISMIIWGVAGFFQAYITTLEQLIVARIILGIGIGAQLPSTVTLLSELLPSKIRARYLVTVVALYPLGMAAAGILCYFLIPTIGWRGVAIVEAIPALVAILVWKLTPESAVWLETKGRYAEADAIMTKMEQRVEKYINAPLPQVVVPAEAESINKAVTKLPLGKMVSKKYIKATIMVFFLWSAPLLATTGLQTWFSMIFVEKGISITKSIGYVSIMTSGGALGALVVPFLLGRYGRKLTVVILSIFTFIIAILYGSIDIISLMVILGMAYYLGTYGMGQTANTYTTELYPTSLRNTALGYAGFVGRIGAIIGPVILGYLIQGSGVRAAVYFAGSMYIISALAAVLLGTETKGKVFTTE
ncbi:MAG: putative niacin/nicotinamide transporter NaiP [Candidatus Dichloromethanomonas elyunquensis]|nr:MAG: putative niacin/nicotinamide transporter NaiP [Candidatus Dichloromethanomonas elyunquensis]